MIKEFGSQNVKEYVKNNFPDMVQCRDTAQVVPTTGPQSKPQSPGWEAKSRGLRRRAARNSGLPPQMGDPSAQQWRDRQSLDDNRENDHDVGHGEDELTTGNRGRNRQSESDRNASSKPAPGQNLDRVRRESTKPAQDRGGDSDRH